MTPAAKRYSMRFIALMMIYSLAVVGVTYFLRQLDPSGPVRVMLALAPVLPALLALREFIIFWRAMDEVQARIHAESLLIAAGVVSFASFSWGFLESWADAPAISVIYVLPAMALVWGVAVIFVSRRFK
ncbi:hypothetical protein F1654_00915 [Alkalicaulis satelles]|uniref:Uncharacterized protein n=1 Tax=Alkalicaulis satelles TaxID=2609175 RepID=A0A5M6ZIE0_9PROT|nr:hypothetical protein [Alkalicaulis satelles]KAA5804602.1 hypothetical protein F1654_00915 [Alkalicaulis satelles]